ncbi:YbjN domain-containing protein [Acidithiobacillus thiooxidans]|uniref:YbjN domain-containing protein n=1 Tax=Acidithiobacillus thiooxidans TaxID=930 RepID=UPI001C078F8C|nr:YbjN domain-containing protein [Acidithiobacillus thiooxidans]MBU2842672.1 YbjN domain-containing protein [Acidithiobacillus thiooxidans]
MNHVEVVEKLFMELEWEAKMLPDYPVMTCALQVPNGTLDIFCHVHEDRERILFYLRPQNLDISAHKRLAVAEFVTRANYGLSLGNFELDMEDGEINFKTILQAPAAVLSTALLRPYLLLGVETINHYLPGLDKVLAGQETPAAAINALETGTAVH